MDTQPSDDAVAPDEPGTDVTAAEVTANEVTANEDERADDGPEAIASTRTSRAWLGVLPVLVVLAVILIFVFQNTQSITVHFLTFSGTLALSAWLLSATALGVLLMVTLGSMRILQLRRHVRRQNRRARDRAGRRDDAA